MMYGGRSIISNNLQARVGTVIDNVEQGSDAGAFVGTLLLPNGQRPKSPPFATVAQTTIWLAQTAEANGYRI